jgi:hypothetical protein
MSPTQPHTTTKDARSCDSCHASDKALGLGIGSTRPWDERHFVDLETTDGTILPKKTRPQMEPIENLSHAWSQIVTPEGEQVATVGHHFKLSRAFNKDELEHISREGTCTACHQEIPQQSLAVSLLHHVAKFTGQLPKTTDQHDSLVHKIVLSSAWAQVLGARAGFFVLLVGICMVWRRRSKNLAAKTEYCIVETRKAG